MKTSEHKEVDKVCFLFLKFNFKVTFFESIVHVRLMSDAACSLSLVADFAKLHKQDYKERKTKHTEVYSDICSKNKLLHLRFCLGLTPSSILQSGCCIVSRILRRHSDKLTFDLWDKTSLN